MSREHARHAQHQHRDGGHGGDDRLDPRQMATMKRAQDRKRAGREAEQSNSQSSPAIAEARRALRDKVGAELRQTVYAALDDYQSMVRADERRDVEVDAGFAKAAGERVSDWLQDKLIDAARESFEMGESVVGGAVGTAFGAAKGRLGAVAEAGAKVRAIDAVDKIVGECRHLVDDAARAGEAAVDRLSDEKMAEIAGVLDLFDGVKDGADGDAEGTLRHGLQNWVMERMGAPRTGGAAIHEHAVELYEMYRAEVRRELPVREQADEVEEATSGRLHRHAEEEAEKAEERLGDADEVKRDTVERQRVENL